MRALTNRREFLAGAAAAGILGGSAAAQTGESYATIASEIARPGARLRGLIPNGSEANLAPTLASWTRLTGIEVEQIVVPVEEINNRMTIDALAGRASYDFALPATFGVADLAWAGIIQPLTGFKREFGTSKGADGRLYELGDVIGADRYGFQTDGDVYLMFWRRDWLEDPQEQARYADRFGTPLELPLTWEETDRQIAYFNRPDEGRYGGALYRNAGYLVWEFWSRLHAKGMLPFDNDLVPQIDSPEGVAALEEMIAVSAHQHPGSMTAGLFENWELYRSNEIYCNIGWGGSQKAFNRPDSPIRNKLAFSALPGGKIPPAAYFNWGWSYVLPANCAEPELAYLFSAYAVSPSVSTRAVRETGGYFDPFHEAHYSDKAIESAYSREFLDVHRDGMKNALPDLYLPGYNTYFGSLTRYLNEALLGETRPADALKRAAQEWQLTSLDFGAEGQLERWRNLRSLYPQHVRPGLGLA